MACCCAGPRFCVERSHDLETCYCPGTRRSHLFSRCSCLQTLCAITVITSLTFASRSVRKGSCRRFSISRPWARGSQRWGREASRSTSKSSYKERALHHAAEITQVADATQRLSAHADRDQPAEPSQRFHTTHGHRDELVHVRRAPRHLHRCHHSHRRAQEASRMLSYIASQVTKALPDSPPTSACPALHQAKAISPSAAAATSPSAGRADTSARTACRG